MAAALARTEPFTRADLTSDTQLSFPTIGSLVTDLIRQDLLRPVGNGGSSAGRRPALMEFNARYGFVVAIDIGLTDTRLALADLRLNLLARRVVPTRTALKPRDLLANVIQDVHVMMSDARLNRERLLAVGVGLPGVVNDVDGLLVAAPNLPGWRDVPVREVLETAFNSPVSIANDANLALVGEHGRGAARGHDTCAFISAGLGIGSAVMIGGGLHRGHSFMAGQIGHLCLGPQNGDGHPRHHRGPEEIAGLPALAAEIPGSAGRNAATRFPAIIEAAGRGEPEARAAVLETARFISIAAANLAVLINPSIIVLGGSLFTQAPALVPVVGAAVQRISYVPVAVVPSALGNEASLWGGLLVALGGARERLRKELREHCRLSA